MEENLTSIHEDVCSVPGLTWWVGDPALLWLWCRLATAAPIQPLAWELPHAVAAALKKKAPKILSSRLKDILYNTRNIANIL